MKIVKKEKKEEILEATCDICGNDCMKELFVPMDGDGDSDDQDIVKEFVGMDKGLQITMSHSDNYVTCFAILYELTD